MPEIQKVTDPTKIVTDKLVLKRLAEQGIDKNYVEFWHDYAPRGLGKEHSPYAKFYRDLKSNKRIMVVSGLPKVKADGIKIEVGWIKQGNRYISKPNLFSAVVDGRQITVTCLSDQPNGTKEGEQVTWQPQLFIDGSEIINGEQPTLLPIDPINENYKGNTLEWDYGTVCKRRIRIIEGRIRERWVFGSNPHSSVRIKHNFAGSLKLRLGRVTDAEGNPLKATVIGDEEIVEASEFDKAIYPVEIGASATFYPDAHPETSSVDGVVYRVDNNTSWANVRNGAGTVGWADNDWEWPGIQCGGSSLWYVIRRMIYLFDTSGLPDICVITAATESFRSDNKTDECTWNFSMNIYGSTPASNIALEPADYGRIGTTPYSDSPITHNNWDAGDVNFNDFPFNATGKAAISKDGVTKTGFRLVPDATDSEPFRCGNGQLGNVHHWNAEKGAGYKPKLVVTYTTVTAPTVTTQAATGIGFD